MVIKLLSSYNGAALAGCEEMLRKMGHEVYTSGALFYCDLVICPDLDTLLTAAQLSEPIIGTLVFHPSPLPRMRGRNAIKRQYEAGDKVGGGTWFWATSGIDNGDICEQEITIINPAVRPREYYETKIIPLMLRTLERAVTGIGAGAARKISQLP